MGILPPACVGVGLNFGAALPVKALMDTKALEKRTKLLLRRHGVRHRDFFGAYHGHPIREFEILLHEVAHWVTLGNSLHTFPKNASSRVESIFATISDEAGDALEVDASFVTYLVGYLMGLWSDPAPIAQASARNLKIGIATTSKVVVQFQERWARQTTRDRLIGMALRIVRWVRPRFDFQSAPPITKDFPEDLSREQPS